jgi:hypothetical protein
MQKDNGGKAVLSITEGIVSIWCGTFKNRHDLESYVEERYDDIDEPVSMFRNDHCIDFLDTDFLEVSFHDQIQPVSCLVEGHSYWDSFVDDLKSTECSGNGVILVYHHEYSRSENFKSNRIVDFLGSFTYKDLHDDRPKPWLDIP